MLKRTGVLWRTVGILGVFGLLGGGTLAIANRDYIVDSLAHVSATQASEHDPDECDDHGHHDSDEPTVATTIWGAHTDVFLERPYPVAGESMEVLSYHHHR